MSHGRPYPPTHDEYELPAPWWFWVVLALMFAPFAFLLW